MNTKADNFGKVLVFVAHPDDETIGCSGLLQRTTNSLVVFAVDGAPPLYGFEKKFGSLRHYSDTRFLEASTALRLIPQSTFRRLARPDGTHYMDQHLFQEMPGAFDSLKQLALEFSPDVIVTHAYEGGHIDHDSCHVLAARAARILNLKALEFPSYWRSEQGHDHFQQFRDSCDNEFTLKLSKQEIEVKQQMLAVYRTQRELTSVFRVEMERFRPMIPNNKMVCTWTDYPFENRRPRLKVECFLRKVQELELDDRTLTHPQTRWDQIRKACGF